MKKMKKTNNKGITLVALVVTIVILIILATVTINAVLGDNGLIKQAEKTKDLAENSILKEGGDMNRLAQEYANMIAEASNSEPPQEIIPQTDSYVGYYADIEGDGTVDGIIYADLAKGNTGDGQWTNSSGNYTIPIETNLKDYYISKENYTGDFETKDVLTPVEGQSGKNDRFYIMALDDIDGSGHYWYKSASGKMSIDTDTAFGTGKTNTQTMISQWNSNKYPPQDNNDMWKLIQTQASKGWFVPSREEWAAFGEELGITGANYITNALSFCYWSSSLLYPDIAWNAYFDRSSIYYSYVESTARVRLSSTF